MHSVIPLPENPSCRLGMELYNSHMVITIPMVGYPALCELINRIWPGA
jgi:hypothetical protein